ncbi:hypothetical protein AWENTII_002325 [Aspergillus wentii]
MPATPFSGYLIYVHYLGQLAKNEDFIYVCPCAAVKCEYCACLKKACLLVLVSLQAAVTGALGQGAGDRKKAINKVVKDIHAFRKRVNGESDEACQTRALRSLNRNVFSLVNTLREHWGMPLVDASEMEDFDDLFAGEVEE